MPKAKERDGVFQRTDRSGWWVSYIASAGKRRKEKVVAHTRTQALNALNGIRTREQREQILGIKEVSEISTADLLGRYKRYQKPRLRPTTFERLDSILKTLKAHLPERAKDMTRKTVSDFISARSETVAPGTIQKETTVLKHALKLAVEWELLHENVAQGAKLPRVPEGRTRYLTPLELKAALDAAPDWMKAPMALAAFTGMRRGELLALRWLDVDMPTRRLYLRDTKNGSLRVLVLNELAVRVLARLPEGGPSDPVLAGVDPQHLTVYTRRIFARLGIHDASFHSLRHTAASWLAMQGVDLYAIGQLLGHKTPRMTQRYAHLSPQYMAGAVGKLDGVFADVMPEGAPGGAALVPVESPHFKRVPENDARLLN
ncbi:MAG: site-specific integrase [Acidobacteria bacterium]|nr:site-specific integrase [Acidobacteriota bacterium]